MKINQTCISPNFVQRYHFWLVLPALAVAILSPALVAAADITWKLTNSVNGVTGNFSDGTSWVGGVAPTSADRAVFSITNLNTPIATVAVSTNIEGFAYTAGTNAVADSGNGATFTINAGQQLSVLGADGFLMHNNATGLGALGPGVKAKRIVTFSGNALLVSNTAANFILDSGVTYNQSGTWDTYTMSGLTNLTFWGNVFALSDGILPGDLQTGEQENQVVLPRTNIITASLANDYTQLDFTNSVEIARQASLGNNSIPQNSMIELGFNNAFYCDSFGLGRGNVGGNTTTMAMSAVNAANGKNSAGYQVSFASVNSAAPTSMAIFRNTDQSSRMKLLAIGVDSGTSATNSRNNGVLNLTGGKVDMLVDQIWLGRNRTNAVGNSDCGGFSFENGTVDVNVIEAGYMQYTNTAFCVGLVLIGTNGTMKVNNYLDLGYSPIDALNSFPVPEGQTLGQVQINNGGKLLANQITVGALSTNDQVIVNTGGLLLVSNSIATSAKSLTTLNLASSAQVTFFVNSMTTNAYLTNLLTGASAALFNIGSFDTNGITSWPVTNVLVSYQVAGSHNVSVGTKPAGATNLNMYVKDETANNQIILITSTNVQKHLVWRGSPGNTLWDHTSPNWTNTDSGGITAFSDNDIVTFDDSASSGNCNITIGDNVTPASILVSNTVNQYVFNGNNNNTYSIGGCSLTKTGTNSLEIDFMPTSIAVSVNKGSLTGSGTVNSIIVASGASMNFAGTDTTSLDDSGSATLVLGGVINGAVNIQSGASFVNAGSTYGALTMGAGSTVNNSGLMSGIGATTVTTNSILNNSGTIYSLSTLTVALGGTLVDTFAGSAGQAPGSINVGTLIVNGTFKPGGNSVSTTKVTDYDYNNGSPGPLLAPNGRIQLNAGSVTVLAVDMGLAPGQTNSVLLSQNQVFGPSQNFKAFNGGTLLITNLNAITKPFAAGQTFKLFARYTDINGDIRYPDPSLNTTNSYPIIQPSTPGPGLVWDFTQLYPHGIIGVLSATDPSLFFTLTNNQYVWNDNGTNRIITQLSWPADKAGGWVQTLTTTLTNGLSATNWVSLNGNYGNTNVGIQIMSETTVWFITNTMVADPTLPGSAAFYRFVYP